MKSVRQRLRWLNSLTLVYFSQNLPANRVEGEMDVYVKLSEMMSARVFMPRVCGYHGVHSPTVLLMLRSLPGPASLPSFPPPRAVSAIGCFLLRANQPWTRYDRDRPKELSLKHDPRPFPVCPRPQMECPGLPGQHHLEHPLLLPPIHEPGWARTREAGYAVSPPLHQPVR